MFQKNNNMKQAMGIEEVGARNAAGKHAVHHAGKRWLWKQEQDFLAHFHTFQVLEETGEVLGNGEAQEAGVELSQEAQVEECEVGRFPPVILPDGGLEVLRVYPALLLLQ